MRTSGWHIWRSAPGTLFQRKGNVEGWKRREEERRCNEKKRRRKVGKISDLARDTKVRNPFSHCEENRTGTLGKEEVREQRMDEGREKMESERETVPRVQRRHHLP